MKTIRFSWMAIMAAAFVLSCAKEENAPLTNDNNGDQPGAVTTKTVTISAKLSEAMTKVGFTPTYTGNKPTEMTLTWEAGDKIRVYNYENHDEYSDFVLASESDGQQIGSFIGTPISATSYDVEVINGDVTFATQTQPSDGVTSNLKYLASVSDITNYNSINFTSFSSVLAITVKMPSTEIAAKVKSIDVKAYQSDGTTAANIFSTGNTLNVTFDTIGDAGNDGILNFYATLPQGTKDIAAGTQLIVKVNAPGETHSVYTRFVELGSGLSFTANKLNTISINASNSASYANASATGIGTSANPYLIGDKYQMLAVHDLLVSDATLRYFKMIDDIDMSGIIWVPLNNTADANKKFSKYIYFDGNGHTISNISTSTTPAAYPSVFGVLNGTVTNLTVDHATIYPGPSTSGGNSAVIGGYIGSSDCTVTPAVTNVTITNSTVGTSSEKGGNYNGIIAGRVSKAETTFSNITISDCEVASTSTVGGLISTVSASMTISGTNSITNTNVSGAGNGTGGFVGDVNAVLTMSGCTYTGGTVKGGGRYTGGMLGQVRNYMSVISNCSVEDATIDATAVTSTDPRSGGFVGILNASATIKGCRVGTEMQKVTLELGTPSAADTKLNCGGFAGCSYGTITKNGDVRSKAFVTITCSNPSSEENSGYTLNLGGFTGYHSGTIEYADANVTMTGTCGKYVGGFCGLLTGGTIRYSSVAGSVSGNLATGGFVGYANGTNGNTLTECSSSATVTRTGTWGIAYGVFAGIVDNAQIVKCSATAKIDVNANYVGGFIGSIETSKDKTASITKCWSTGNVGSSSAQCGGFIARIAANTNGTVTIQDCYETGNLTGGNQRKGGFIAQITSGVVTVSRCYSTATMSGSFAQGGLVGFMETSATIEDCAAWNSSITAATIGSGNWSSGAVIGVAWPKATLSNNVRKSDISIKAYWGNVTGYTKQLATDYDHPDVSSTNPLIVVDKNDGTTLRQTTAAGTGSGNDNYPQFAYHGRHVAGGTSLSTLASTAKASGGLGWSSDVWDFTGDLPTLK